MKFECYVTFHSVTAAQRAALALARSGSRAPIVRTPRAAALHGCGYSLVFFGTAGAQAARTLRRLGLPFDGLVCADGAGGWREVPV